MTAVTGEAMATDVDETIVAAETLARSVRLPSTGEQEHFR